MLHAKEVYAGAAPPSSVLLSLTGVHFLPASCHNLFCLESEKQDLLAGVKAVTAVSGYQLQLEGFCTSYFSWVIFPLSVLWI